MGKKREEKGRESVGFSQEPKKTGSNRPNNFNQNLCTLFFYPSEKKKKFKHCSKYQSKDCATI